MASGKNAIFVKNEKRNVLALSRHGLDDVRNWEILAKAAEKQKNDLKRVQTLLESGISVNSLDDTIFVKAAEKNDLTRVQTLLESGISVNSLDDTGCTALHRAAGNGSVAMTQFLLNKGAERDLVDSLGKTPLHWAAESGKLKTCEVLLQNGASINLQDSEGKTSLHWAAQSEQPETYKLLLRKGASVNIQDSEGKTAIDYPRDNRHKLVVKAHKPPLIATDLFEEFSILLRDGISLNARDSFLCTPLHRAVQKGSVKAMELLVKHDAKIDSTDHMGKTPLHCAAMSKNLDALKFLVQNGASVNKTDDLGQTALHLSAIAGDAFIAQWLLSNNAKPYAKDKEGYTPRDYAVKQNHADVTQVFVKYVAELDKWEKMLVDLDVSWISVNIHARDMVNGRTPLHWASEYGTLEMMEILVQSGASVNAKDNEGCICLHLAAGNGNIEITQFLVSHGAEIDAMDSFKKSALQWAAATGQFETLKFLVLNRAQVNTEDSKRRRPLHIVSENGRVRMTRFLVLHGAKVNAKDFMGKTALLWAAEVGQLETVEVLLDSKALVNAEDKEGRTALHWAAINGHTAVIKSLLQKSADLKVVDKTGKTALHLAAVNGHVAAVELLLLTKAKQNIKDKQGRTPQDLAMHYKKDSVLEAFQLHGNVENTDRNIEKTLADVFEFPDLQNVEDFENLIARGTYESYDNRVYLAGPCNVGKTTLASVLIGESIPNLWRSTNGLVIYFGRNGIKLKEKEMIPLKNGVNTHGVITKLLIGNPEINKLTPDYQHTHLEFESRMPDEVFQHKDVNKADDFRCEETEEPQIDISKRAITEVIKTATSDSSIMKQSNEVQAIQPLSKLAVFQYTAITIHKHVLDQIKKGIYKVEIAPSDLTDFGGQRSFDMTHQLFVQHRGTFVLMFDGRKSLHELLHEYPQGNITAASILVHWVNSILIYCTKSDDKMPRIVFTATHSDSFEESALYYKKKEFVKELTALFASHKHHHHIEYSKVFFINATKRDDLNISLLTDQLVEIAFEQSTWGKRMPNAWVPLELQLADMRMHNITIITRAELIQLNDSNKELALNESQLAHFLRVQHSLGKIQFFEQPGLDNCIIVQPTAMVNILRSFVTDQQFWPKAKRLRTILKNLYQTGKIKRVELFELWSQAIFSSIMPDDQYKSFVVGVLVHLDILVEPNRYRANDISVDYYLVPCVIRDNAPTNFFEEHEFEKRTICLAYRIKDESIVPAALSFKLIGAAINIWPLKEIDGRLGLFYQSAIMDVDEDNELRILVESETIVVYLTNNTSKHLISPDVAASVQECLTLALTKVLQFYHLCSGRSTVGLDISSLFEMYVGLVCAKKQCMLPLQEAKVKKTWECTRNQNHTTKYLLYWIFDKHVQDCKKDCRGLDSEAMLLCPTDKHIVRLANQIGIGVFDKFVIHLGMTRIEWEGIEYQYDRNGELSKKLMALLEWRKKKEAKLSQATLKDLSNALSAIEQHHSLCQIVREDTSLLDIADAHLQEIPSNDVLNRLPRQMGNCVIQLGIELGLTISKVEEIMYNNPKDMYTQLYEILRAWKQSCRVTPTIYRLMLALQRVDAGGLTFLRKLGQQDTITHL